MGLEKVKGKVRGVAGVLERRGFDAGQEKRVSQANSRIKKIFDMAKVDLTQGEYRKVYIFSGQLIKPGDLYKALNPLKLSRVKITKETKIESIDKEISWASEKVIFFSKEISKFLKFKKIIDRAVIRGEYELAERALNKLENSLGQSVWAAKKKIQISGLVHGIKEQKKLSDKLRRESGRGPISFIIHQESVRIENNTKAEKFEADNQRRLNEFKKINFMRNYLLYSVGCSHDTSNTALAEILSFSGSMSIMDYYESLIDALSISLLEKVGLNNSLYNRVEKVLGRLSVLPDERITFMRSCYGFEVEDELFRSVKKIQDDVISSAIESCEEKEISHYKKVGNGAIKNIIYRKNTEEAFDALKKVCLSFSGHLYSSWMLNLVEQDRKRNVSAIFKCYPDFKLRFGCIEDHEKEYPQEEYKSLLTSMVLNGSPSASAGDFIRSTFNDASQAVREILEGGEEGRFFAFFHGQDSIVRSYIFDLIIGGMREDIVDIFLKMLSSERVRDDGCHNYLNIVDVFSDDPWKSVSGAKDVIDKAVFFDFIHNRTGEPRIETFKRFSLEDIMNFYNVEDIEGFLDKVDKNDERIRVVLKNVCVPSIIDMLDLVDNSKEVYCIRKRICEFIIDCYGEDESINAEIENIKAVIKLNEISDFVDSNKVFVDEDGMAAWNKRNLKQDFERFLTLVDPKKKNTVSLEELLIGQHYDPLLLSSADIDESDIQLYDMLEKMKKQFLFDASFGLDGYLSKRVRHNTLHLFLRSSFKGANFVTLKGNADDEYRDSEYWRERLGSIDESDRWYIINSLKKFSESFDSEVLRIVDNYLHVRSPDKPRGMLDIPLSDTYLLALKSSAIEHRSLATLSSHVATAFWTLLKPYLDEVKVLLREKFRKNIDSYFDALQASVKKVSIKDKYKGEECFKDLGAEITRSHSVLIDNIDRAANWFSQSRAEFKSVPQNVNEIFSTLIHYVNSQHSGRDPDCSLDCPENIRMQFHNVLIIADVVKDLLENVYSHCGVERKVKINIRVSPSQDMQSLNVLVVNSLSREALMKARLMNKEKIMNAIESGEWKNYVRKEGESGLYKIWSSSAASGNASIDFGVSSSDEFYVELDLPVIGKVSLQ